MNIHKSVRCCNPFGQKHSSVNFKDLRPVQPWMVEQLPNLSINYKICSKCRKQLTSGALPEKDSPVLRPSENSTGSDSDSETLSKVVSAEAVSALNVSLQSIGQSPVQKKRLTDIGYRKKKMTKVNSALQSKLFCIPLDNPEDTSMHADTEIIFQLKEKFKATERRSEKIQLLTVLPKSWSIRKIQQEFEAPNYMVRKAKQLVKEKGILSTPNPKPGKCLDQNVADLITEFYCSDEISRCLPGKKDYVSVKEKGVRVHKQKRLILCNLKEAYVCFKAQNENVKVGLSKFCEMRPKNCVLAGASGTHSVCVCSTHQNTKLMVLGGKLKELTRDDDVPLGSYQACLSTIICNPPLPDCYFGKCLNCPGTSEIEDRLRNMFDVNGIDDITYKQWISTDRSTLETLTKSSDEFVDTLVDQLKSLLPHSFLARQQSQFQNELKSTLKPGEYLVVCDFAENYSFVLQDEVQGFHWNNDQATLHPFVAYFNDDSNDTERVHHISFVVISDCLKHDTVAVHLFQRHLILFLTHKFGKKPNHIFYFSDGCAAQYKNRKNFINVCHHKEDFGVSAEWHFYASSHGKGVCDGVAGTIKRLATRASLQKPYSDQIMSPQQLYDWAKDNIQACYFCYSTTKEYSTEEEFLRERLASALTIPGTQKLHHIKPVDCNTIVTKKFSSSLESKRECVCAPNLKIKDIRGYVTCQYDGKWWVGYVLNVNLESNEVTISFLSPNGPSPSYSYPEKQHILIVHKDDVYATVDLRTATGRTYFMSTEDTNKIIQHHKLSNQ